jgi:hypothetical protein
MGDDMLGPLQGRLDRIPPHRLHHAEGDIVTGPPPITEILGLAPQQVDGIVLRVNRRDGEYTNAHDASERSLLVLDASDLGGWSRQRHDG